MVFSLQLRESYTSRSSNDATDGAFKIKESSFRQFISRQPGAEFPLEKGRCHLCISYASPWASRCYAFMKLKGLEDDVIGLTISLFSPLLSSA
jgi:putative glutathione S-transferase